jgi:tetrahydromethanopterin S-methyltransferase subunit B
MQEEALMDVFTMVTVIVIASMAYAAYEVHMKTKAKIAAKGADSDMAAMRTDVERLKERVRVLEQIVTDQERQLSEEIRRLA